MKSILIKLVLGIALGLGGYFIADMGSNYITEETFKEGEKMCQNGSPAEAILDSIYTESVVKIMKVKTKMYTFNYSYNVNGAPFKGEFTTNTIPQSSLLTVWYDKSSPEKSVTSEPCKTFEVYQSKSYSPYKDWFAYIGFPMMIIGAGLAYAAVKNGIRFLISGNKS